MWLAVWATLIHKPLPVYRAEGESAAVQVLMQAVRSAAQIIDLFLKLGPCWKKLVAAGEPYSAEFMSISTELQKGTRTLQILCSEAKSKKELGIVAKVRALFDTEFCTAGLILYLVSDLAKIVGQSQRWEHILAFDFSLCQFECPTELAASAGAAAEATAGAAADHDEGPAAVLGSCAAYPGGQPQTQGPRRSGGPFPGL